MINGGPIFSDDYGPQRLTVELVNICNLHCSYCFRAEENLYGAAEFFPIDLLRRVIDKARQTANVSTVNFTGGEPTLHPHFQEALATVGEAGLKASFVTNGWHFERIWPALVANRASLTHVAFSLDGVTHEGHDRWRGAGSFGRLIRAFTRCYKAKLPFVIKVTIRRDLVDQLEQIAIFAARLGASGLTFVHAMPTSSGMEEESSLNFEERRAAEEEIAILARMFKMSIGLDVGYYNIDDTRPPCSPLAGTSMNVDYKGRLSLCCNLSGFRDAEAESDVVADLNTEEFASAYEKLMEVASVQVQRRKDALATLRSRGIAPDLYIGSPCLFCLQNFGKIPWHDSVDTSVPTRPLPVCNSTA